MHETFGWQRGENDCLCKQLLKRARELWLRGFSLLIDAWVRIRALRFATLVCFENARVLAYTREVFVASHGEGSNTDVEGVIFSFLDQGSKLLKRISVLEWKVRKRIVTFAGEMDYVEPVFEL